MFKTKVGYSVNIDDFKAGAEAASKLEKLGNLKLVTLFTNCDMNQSDVLDGIKSVIGNKALIGCTSSGGIVVPDGLIRGKNYAGVMGFSDDDLIVGVAGSAAGKNAREVGKKIARQAITNAGIKKVPSYFYMIASPGEEEDYLKGIEDVIGSVPFFGGSTADDTLEGKWSIFCNDQIFSDGCAVAFFYAKNEMKNLFTGAYKETKDIGIITKTEGKRQLVEIDGVKAVEKYASWINRNPSDLSGLNLFVTSVRNPLGIKDPIGNLTLIRHPLICNEDYSMSMSNHLTEGTAVIRMTTTNDELINSNRVVLNELNNKMKRVSNSYFLICSSARKMKEFIMIFTFGEYGSLDHSANSCGSLSLSFTSFSE